MLTLLYSLTVLGLSVYALQSLLLTILYFKHRRDIVPLAAIPADGWPHVTVQLPIFNEKYVVERLVAAAAALDYPHDRLTIQVFC